MVTEQEEILWGYLLDPCFELSNTAGKPLTNGWIEVYIHGTRNKYYCASDFDGTLHPFKIPLDSLGSNIVLADPNRSYDVYVYDRFGSLEMSRYNVSPGHASGAAVIGGGDAEHWLGRDGSVTDVTNNVPKTLELPQIGVDYEGSFIDHINGQNTAMYLKPGIYLINAVVEFKQDGDDLTNTIGQVQINTGLDNVEDQSFDRNETGPDAGDGYHYMKVMFIRHVTGEDDGSDVLHINIQSPNDLSMARIWSLQIAKLGDGSASHVQQIEYEAGQYIDIDGDVINVTGLQPAGDYVERAEMSAYQPAGDYVETSALSSYVTQNTYNQGMYDVHQTLQAHGREIDEVSGALDQKADRSDIPSLEGYATESWVQNQHYLTSVPDNYVKRDELSSYATDQEVQAAVSGKADKSEIPSLAGYATETYVQGQVSGLASETYVQSQVSGKQDELTFTYDSENKITSIDGHGIAGTGGGGGSSYIPGQYISIQNDVISVTGLQPSGDYVEQSEMSAYQPAGDYLTQDDLNGYATTEDIEAAVSGKADVSAIPSVAGLASEQYVDEHIAEATSGKADVSAIPSLQGYATESWVNEQGFLKEVPQGYATTEDVEAATSGKMDNSQSADFYPMASNPSGYLTEHQSLAGYATQEWVNQQGFVEDDALEEATSGKMDASAYTAPVNADWSATSGLAQILNKPDTEDLTPGQYISIQGGVLSVTGLQVAGSYATEDYLQSQVSGKQDQLEFNYDDDQMISGINGSAIKSGDTLPEGVMNTSGLEYTAGGQISAYNESAFCDVALNDLVNQNSGAWGGAGLPISAGPGIKVGLENGVLMISSEDVLYEGSVISSADNTVVSVSGNPTDYSRIGLFGFGYETGKSQYCELDPSYSGTISTFVPYPNGNNLVFNVDTLSFSGTNQITFLSQKHWYNGGVYAGGMNVYKIVGIGRKST